jgi:hypothetical protein
MIIAKDLSEINEKNTVSLANSFFKKTFPKNKITKNLTVK